jgi:hypothetical protein
MRRSARVAAAADRATALAPLPMPLVHRIFLLLPVDERARAACICKGWRAVLAEPALWTQLDLLALFERNKERFKREPERAGALLRGAARRAQGQVQRLVVSWPLDAATPVLLEVLAANAGSLRELKLPGIFAFVWPCEDRLLSIVEPLFAAAPRLEFVDTDVTATWQDAQRLLRVEGPLSRVRLRRLFASFTKHSVDGEMAEPFGGLERIQLIAAALADATLQPTLSAMCIGLADLQQPGVIDALADAVLARRLRSLEFQACTPPAPASLARLLAGGVLTCLTFRGVAPGVSTPLFDPAGATLVAAALRANTTLTSLVVSDAGLFSDTEAAQTLLAALVGHRSICSLELTYDDSTEEPEALGAALGAIVAADAPALVTLDVSGCGLGLEGLALLVGALPQNRHLRTLVLSFNGISATFVRDHLLPAVRANTSLRQLECQGQYAQPTDIAPAVQEVQELLKHRTQRS